MDLLINLLKKKRLISDSYHHWYGRTLRAFTKFWPQPQLAPSGSQTLSPNISVWPHWCSCGWMGENPRSGGKSSQKRWEREVFSNPIWEWRSGVQILSVISVWLTMTRQALESLFVFNLEEHALREPVLEVYPHSAMNKRKRIYTTEPPSFLRVSYLLCLCVCVK